MDGKQRWWKKGIIYQIYPRSFQDSNRDGVGDLRGITQRIDYVAALGVDAIWISPIFPSPMLDFGYDIADYCGIDPLFGAMEDFDNLLAEAHARGLKVILDLVPNHTSDQHRWFKESRSSRENERRDWYIWRDPRPDGSPPNNWLSMFGGSAWELDEYTGQYYLHTFLKEQPDLNWRDPWVKAAMFGVMHFWLAKGVDGFRVDVIYALIKDEKLRNDPPNPHYKQGDNPYESLRHVYSLNRPEVHKILREMRHVLECYDRERLLIGETFHLSNLKQSTSYLGRDLDECHLPFNFQLIVKPWDLGEISNFVEDYVKVLPQDAWPNGVVGNHDQHRITTRAGGLAQARVAQMLLLSLRGTPTCYYGDEIGMTDVAIPPDRVRDPFGIRVPGQSRDHSRTPMQWDASPYAGFSTVEPWLPIAENYQEVNVAAESQDASSILTLFRSLTALRRATPALTIGSFSVKQAGCKDAYVYCREHENDRILVALNFSPQACTLEMGHVAISCDVLLSTHLDRYGEESLIKLHLRPNEGIIARLAEMKGS